MSVINNVLKDLESRSSGFTPIDVSSVETDKRQSSDKPRWTTWVALLVVVSVSVAGYLGMNGYFDQAFPIDNQQASVKPAQQKPVSEAAVTMVAEPRPQPIPVVEAPVVERNEIIGLQLKESTADLVLEFALKERVISYLKERSENRFVYHIRDVDNQIVAPLLQDNPWLRQLALQDSDNGVDIRFTTKDNLLVETSQSSASNEWIWRITFRKAPEPEVVTPVVKAAKPVVSKPEPETTISRVEEVKQVEQPKPVESPAADVAEPAAEPEPILSITSKTVSGSDDSQLVLATRLIKNGQLGEAQNMLVPLLDGAQDLRVRRLLHGVYSRSGNRDAYQSLLRDSMQRYPDESEFVSRYAGLLFRDRDYPAVIDFFSQRLPIEAGHYSMLAMSYQREARYDEAVLQFKEALKLDGRDSKNWAGLAISLEQQGDLDNALKAFQQAQGIGGLSPRLRTFVRDRIASLQQVIN